LAVPLKRLALRCQLSPHATAQQATKKIGVVDLLIMHATVGMLMDTMYKAPADRALQSYDYGSDQLWQVFI